MPIVSLYGNQYIAWNMYLELKQVIKHWESVVMTNHRNSWKILKWITGFETVEEKNGSIKNFVEIIHIIKIVSLAVVVVVMYEYNDKNKILIIRKS